MDDRTDGPPRSRPRVHPGLDLIAAYSWRILPIALVGAGFVWALGQLRIVLFPMIAAVFLTVVLWPVAEWLRRRNVPNLLSTWLVFLGFVVGIAVVGTLIVPSIASEFENLGPTVERAVDDVEEWLVEDAPFDVTADQAERWRQDWGEALARAVGGPRTLAQGAVVAAEIVAGTVLSLVLTFFFLKDGTRFRRWALARVPEGRRPVARRLGRRAWSTLGGYLRGAAMLGTVEAVVIGLTLAIVGGTLVVPVMVVTFAAAFVPLVGAIVAGVIAVLVAFTTGGSGAALAVAAVAILVQQFDNDLLAPFIFGKTLELHPVVVLLAVSAGVALGGIGGAFLAVPLTGVVVNVVVEARDSDISSDQPATLHLDADG
jgi:predicted PurR-regulated permease PerM